jgi:hypothetical protein
MVCLVIACVITVSCKRLDPATGCNFLQEPAWRQCLGKERFWRAELAEAVAVVQLAQQQAPKLP